MPTGTRPNVPNVAQVEMIYTSANERCENVYHVYSGTGWTTASLETLAGYFATWESATARAQRSDNVILTLIRARDMSSPGGAEIEDTHSTVGALSPGHLPNNATISVKLNTGLRGRSFRGRSYWIGLNDVHIDASGQSVTNTFAGNVVTIMEALRGGAIPNSGQIGVVSLVSGGAYRGTGIFTPGVAYVLIDQYIDSQRRRLIGHNRHR